MTPAAPVLSVHRREARAEERSDTLGGRALEKVAVVLLQDVPDMVGVSEQIEPSDAERQGDDVAEGARRLEEELQRVSSSLRKDPEERIAPRARGRRRDASASRHGFRRAR